MNNVFLAIPFDFEPFSYVALFVGISFLYFGTSCLTTKFMRDEFSRYGLTKYRPLIGILQIIGGTCMLLGLIFSPLLVYISAIGLCLLMLAGFSVRLYIRDSLFLSMPSLLYAILSFLVSYCYYFLL